MKIQFKVQQQCETDLKDDAVGHKVMVQVPRLEEETLKRKSGNNPLSNSFTYQL